MAEPQRDRDPNAPQNPPQSVVNKDVRRSALRTYLLPLVLFFGCVAIVFMVWRTSPPPRGEDRTEPRAEGTTGTERERARERTPGGHNPDRKPSSTEEELEHRGGRVINTIEGILEDGSRDVIGRRVELHRVNVERVESPTLLWIRDGNARVAVSTAVGSTPVKAGQSIDVAGTIERAGPGVRIRASRVGASR